MYFRTRSNVADLALYEDGGIDCFEGFDRLFGLKHVLLEWQCGSVEDDCVKPGSGSLYSLRQGVCMLGVKKDWEIEFLTQNSHPGCNLIGSYKLALALGHPNQTRDAQFV